MNLENIKRALLASYQNEGGINHLEGSNLPAEESINQLARDFMYVLFPGFFGEDALEKKNVPAFVDRMLESIETRLTNDIRKSLVFAGVEDAETRAKEKTMALLERLPELRRVIQTDVVAAYEGDPAARSVEEIILAYPCVLVISLQRIAHELYLLNVPLLPRMLTEYGHERTGTDIHPGATIGTHFFIDHCTGVVIGETARIGNHVKIYQGVTLGAKSFELDEKGHPVKGVKRHPELRDNVIVYPGATILGGDTVIGENSIVGSNVWLMQSMPANSIAYYQGDAASVIRPRSTKEQLLGETGD
ncbi:serine O-acetyltransferase [Ereboglobus sp. PH5-5]|uniref:serine O-acetyltransferase n=1 Tax=Ereboglobus sp. PH5-5 TaxID=2940529 RepID=UPI00240733EC|nr:serine O-acetyltransferase [Ereboglobus sp. PH5-5]MDF9832173.1 serine O-acetyltransferase [Ereboglobus sp. PH5-5]